MADEKEENGVRSDELNSLLKQLSTYAQKSAEVAAGPEIMLATEITKFLRDLDAKYPELRSNVTQTVQDAAKSELDRLRKPVRRAMEVGAVTNPMTAPPGLLARQLRKNREDVAKRVLEKRTSPAPKFDEEEMTEFNQDLLEGAPNDVKNKARRTSPDDERN